MSRTRDLHDGWSVRARRGPVPESIAAATIPAQVPGVVHLDLLRAGLIPDPYLDDNEALLAWIGLVDWDYETAFTMDAAEVAASDHHDLVFDGLDTVATVRLNGTVVAETANQHRTYRIDVTDALVAGENRLEVSFRSPVKYANAQSVALGARPRPYPLPYDAIRKSACSFGWDWGISTATSGIWRAVRLESWSTARLASVRVRATPAGDGASDGTGRGAGDGGVVEVDVEIEKTDAAGAALALRVAVNGPGLDADAPPSTVVTVDGDRVRARVELPSAQRWWPVGYGDQPLYTVDVALEDSADSAIGQGGAMIDAASRRVGFRTVEWNTVPDESGTPFQLVVNDVPVFVKGVNWIPDDAFPSRVDRARYERRLRQARDANVNLIRVWGGGIYEADDFYEVADELGLLTWQDFLFACAAYSEGEPLRTEVEAEARDNVARLAHHASLVLLNGNNENLWGFEDWGWKKRLDGADWGAGYYYDLLPALVAELAPQVPYAPGSPFSPGAAWDAASGAQSGPHPNDERHGTMHLWEQWNRQDYPTYRDHRPRFVAEFGWQGPPTWTTLTRSISDDPLTPESPGMIVHQKAAEGNGKLTDGLLPHFRLPRDMETWHWAMQLNQANAVGTALEWFRSQSPHTSGAIVWQLNDCWPVTSWAAIDGDERPKPLFHALKNAFAPRLVTIQPAGDGLVAAIVNDSPEAWTGTLALRRVDFSGETLAEQSVDVAAAPRETVTVTMDAALTAPGDPSRELVLADLAGGARAHWFFAEPRDSALESALLEVTTETIDGGTLVTVRADSLVRDLALLIDKVDPDAAADAALVTLLPGESARIAVRHEGAALPASLLSDPRVLRTANELVAS